VPGSSTRHLKRSYHAIRIATHCIKGGIPQAVSGAVCDIIFRLRGTSCDAEVLDRHFAKIVKTVRQRCTLAAQRKLQPTKSKRFSRCLASVVASKSRNPWPNSTSLVVYPFGTATSR
jgi:hypothetical protein